MDINTVLDMFEEKYIHAAVMLAPDNPDAVLPLRSRRKRPRNLRPESLSRRL